MTSPERRILKDFKTAIPLYESLGKKVQQLLTEIIDEFAGSVRYHSITYRVKTTESLRRKLLQKQYKDLSEVTDLLGLRVITYFPLAVDIINSTIGELFAIDSLNSVDKRTNDNPAEFGYASLHLVASLSPDRLAHFENKKFAGLKFEIQVRTLLQHAWAEIEHDIVYKPHSMVPTEVKRLFYRMAALLEVADLDFQRASDIICFTASAATTSTTERA